MGSSQSTQPGAQGNLGARVGQVASTANQAALGLASGLGTAAQTTTALTQSAAQLAQAAGPALNSLRLAMANLQRMQGATYGGNDEFDDDSYFGGNDEADPAKGLREYEASLSAKAKEDTVRRLARALKRAGINVDPEGDLDEIVKQLVDQIPNPRKGKTFAADAQAQEKVCRTVADVLNDEFTPGVTKAADKFIDTSLSAVEICRAVGEWAHSFAAGVNTEFLAVHASVRNVLRTVEVLDQIMKEIYEKIREKVNAAEDAKLGREFDPLNEIYTRAQNERKRQEEVLKNILHVQLAPAAKELELALRDESEQNALIKRLGLKPGTSEFADSLAMAISGLGTAASVAQRVHKALKQVGLSVRQYLESPEYAEFQRMLDSKIESGTIKADDLAKFIEAMQTLRLNFDSRNEPRFREALEEAEKMGGRRHRRRHGGANDDYKSTIDKRVERAKTEKSLIIRDFVGRMARHYDEVLASIKALSPELGKKIPLTEKTDALRDALVRLRDMREARIELALIGYYMDAEARERKERFIGALRLVSSSCAALMELEMYRPASAYFARLKAAIDGLEKTVDYFSDVVVKKFGGENGDDDDVDAYLEEVYEGGRRHHKRGGADDDLLPEISRSALSLNEAVSEFSYFYYVARIRANLEQTAKELDAYGEKYVEVLGDAVAARLWTLDQEKIGILGHLTDTNRAAAGPMGAPPAGPLNVPFGAPGTAGAPNVRGDAWFAAARRWVEQEYEIKTRFYKVLQAMDLYMKAFTTAIVKDPDAVRDIKKMLDGTQVIARWFSDQTGDFLCRAFDHMGSTPFDGTFAAPAAGAAVLADNNNARPHYYQKVHQAVTVAPGGGATTFGIPEIGIRAADAAAPGAAAVVDHAAEAKKAIANAMDYFQALKNLMNAFSRIGDRFGGRELRAQVFMSPTQIYKTLMDYMKQSAMSIRAGTKDAVPAGDIAVPITIPGQGAGLAGAANVAAGVRPYQVYFGSVLNGLLGNYEVEDRYFALIIKAMAAKILTTLGVYDMFERRTPLYELTPTRFIVGGAEDSDPEPIEGACELYFRLPRLVEFYRAFLRWDGSGADSFKIAMLPELEGIFSGLIRIIFQKMSAPESGDYSDSELRSVVREINAIYTHFREKDADRAVHAAMSSFVMEINRRYGVIKKDDMVKYWTLVRRVRRLGEYGDVNDTNYAILPGEDEVDVERRAPSDRYVFPPSAAPGAPGELPREFRGRSLLDTTDNAAGGQKAMLRKFRADIEKEFADIPRAQFGRTSYALLIKQAEAEMRRSTSKEGKLAVAMKLIQGTTVVSLDANKAFMFHETVITGLNMLGTIYTLLQNLSDAVDTLDPVNIENTIMDALHAAAVLGAPPNPVTRAVIQGGAPFMNTTAYQRYIYDGSSNVLPGTLLYLRGGLAGNVGAGNFYMFWRREGTYVNGAAGRQLPAPPSSYTGQETPANLTGDQLRTLRALRLFARFVTNYNVAMRDLIENLFDLSSSFGNLVEVRFPQSPTAQVQVNFSKLRSMAETLLADVKYYLDLFRPFIDKTMIDRFEARSTAAGAPNVGSVFWLEENLVDVMFRGRSEDPADQDLTLDGLSRRITRAFANLTRDTYVPVTIAVTAAALGGANDNNRLATIIAPAPANAFTRSEAYGRTLCDIAFYDASDTDSGQTNLALNGGPVDAQYDLGNLIRLPRAARGAPPVPASNNNTALQRFLLYRSDGGMTRYRSLLFAFNQLLARYLNVLSDPAGTRRIYLNLINALANGTASRSVSDPSGNSFPDLAIAGTVFGRRGDPKPTAVVLQSLSYVLARLVKDVNPATQVSEHLVNTLTDVPLYLKESFRANLPGFVRLFDLIVQKAEFLKQLMQKTNINCGRQSQRALTGAGANIQIRIPGADHGGAAHNSYTTNALNALEDLDTTVGAPPEAVALVLGKTSEDMKARLAAIIDAISTNAYTLSTSATEVLKELGDQPVYFQTQEGSIETYKARYGKLPLMPLSLSLYFLSDLTPAGNGYDDLKLFPKVSLGEPQFKAQYGVRGLLMRPSTVSFEQMPGVKATLDAYNGVSAKREQIDPERYLNFLRTVVGVLRYATEARNYKSTMSTSNAVFSFGTLIGPAITPQVLVPGAAPSGNASYAIGKDVQAVVTVVESSNQDEEALKIVAIVGAAAGAAGDRRMERILNLVDMNIIPINVHALMRDIPLANLYNYEYTFEQMIAALYGEAASRYTDPADPNYVNDARTMNTRQMFLRLLINPYLNLDANGASQGQKLYGSDVFDLGTAGFVHRIFRGDNNLGMGRPKFLSDQLFNKALFGSIYQAVEDYDEAGPGVGAGISRGRVNVGLRAIQLGRERTIAAVQTMEALFAYLNAQIARVTQGVGALDDAGAGDLAINNMLAGAAIAPAAQTPAQMITAVVTAYLAELTAVQAITAPFAAGNADVAAYDAELQAQIAVAAGANGVAPGTNLRGLLQDVAAGGAARLRMAYDALRGATQAGGPIDTIARMARQRALITGVGVGGNPARSLDSVTRVMAAVAAAAPQGLPAQTTEWVPQGGRRAQRLSFLAVPAAAAPPESAVVELDLGAQDRKARLEAIGRLRFDTRLVRNIFFITNTLRLVRLKLNRELTQSRNVLVSSHSAVAPSVTEYGADPFGPNEVIASNLPSGMARFNDKDEY